MNYDNILSENKEEICYITINRPTQLNALNGATISELNQAIIVAEKDKLIRCIILTGADTKAFVAGADIKEFAKYLLGLLQINPIQDNFNFLVLGSNPLSKSFNVVVIFPLILIFFLYLLIQQQLRISGF